MKCNICNGEKELLEHWEPGVGGYSLPCYRCDGKGSYSFWNYLTNIFWENAPVRFIEWYADTFFKEN